MKRYLEKIRPGLDGIIDDLNKSEVTMKPKYESSTESNEKCTMYTKCEITIGNTSEIIQ